MDKVFITGVVPGRGGAGDYLSFLLTYFETYEIIKINQKNDFGIVYKFTQRLFLQFRIFLFSICRIKRIDKIVVYSPQTVGYFLLWIVLLMSPRINVVLIYVDCSFFCKKSYNVYEGKECFRCIESKPYWSCNAFPQPQSNFFMRILRTKRNVKFVVQHRGHQRLLERLKVNTERITILPMITNEILEL